MTTVGYGDKTPRSVAGRLFSVLWILAGIIVFNFLAGEMISVILQSKSPGDTTMANKKVGTLNRHYENSLVIRNGGILAAKQETEGLTDEQRFFATLEALKTGKINGFLIDKYTYRMFKDRYQHETRGDNSSVDYFLHKTMLTDVPNTGNDLSYGLLIKFQNRYNYFQPMFESNKLAIESDIHRNVVSSSYSLESESTYKSTQIHNEISIWFLLVPIACIFCFGGVFEVCRKKKLLFVEDRKSKGNGQFQRNGTTQVLVVNRNYAPSV